MSVTVVSAITVVSGMMSVVSVVSVLDSRECHYRCEWHDECHEYHDSRECHVFLQLYRGFVLTQKE